MTACDIHVWDFGVFLVFSGLFQYRELHGNGDGSNTAVTAGIPRFYP